MKQIFGEELKKVELDILVEVAKFCEENQLQYFLAYGTLIGAVRHNGFIPWDDDIDLQMPRKDYNRLIELFNKKHTGCLALVDPTQPHSRHSYVKIVDTRTVKIENGVSYKNGFLGVDIDIFPVDGQPDDDITFDKWYSKLQRVYRFYSYNILEYKGSMKRKIALPFIKLFATKKSMKRIADKMHAKYPYEDSKYVGAIECCYNSHGNRAKKECYEGYITLSFEGKELRAPIGYESILKNIYGDYMKLPPIEKQVSHHSYNAYWKEEC